MMLWLLGAFLAAGLVVDITMRARLKSRARLCNRWQSGAHFCTCSMCGPAHLPAKSTEDGE
jgi:hypothetical protein